MSINKPFKPSFGGKVIVIGCSDNNGRSSLQELKPGPKVTTYQRTAAALEAYWAERAEAGRMPTGDKVPGGEKQLAHKTREACWKDSVHLEQDVHSALPEWQGTPSDIEDKETIRTRGIPGFTGKQPHIGQSKPPQPAPDTSSWVAINAFDEPKPRVKGIVGYTGHQPSSPAKGASGLLQSRPAADTHWHQQLQHMGPTVKATWCDQSSSAAASYSNGSFAPSTGLHISTATTDRLASVHAAAEPYGYRPGSNTSDTSILSSPRFHVNGVKVPPDGVQVPRSSSSAVTIAHQSSAAAGHAGFRQQQQQQHPHTLDADGPPKLQAVRGVPVGSSSNLVTAACPGSSACTAAGCIRDKPHAQQQFSGSQVEQQQQHNTLSPRRARATTYTAAFSEASRFGLQRYTQNLQLACSTRPPSALAAGKHQGSR